MNIRLQLIQGLIIGTVIIDLPAEIPDEKLANDAATRLAIEQMLQKHYTKSLKSMAEKLPEFRAVSKNKNLVTFLIEVTSIDKRKVLKTVTGKTPTDALSFVADHIIPPGIYLVGILRPDPMDSFMRRTITKVYIMQVDQNDARFPKGIMQADLPVLLGMKKSEQAVPPNGP